MRLATRPPCAVAAYLAREPLMKNIRSVVVALAVALGIYTPASDG